MDSFFTSLNKRQSMLLLTAVTFGGQESLGAMEHLPTEEGELLRHRAQEILQIPRDKRIPALVQEIKRLVKDRRGQLWTAEPERLAALLQRERGALVEIVLRALPAALAEAVRGHLPPPRVKLTREVRPQVLDIVRWKLEEALARETGTSESAGFKFSDVLLLTQRELFTVCDRLGARVLGPALAGLPDAEREALLEPLPPDLKLLASKSVAANAPRKLPEEDARAQLEQHDALRNPAGSIRSAGVQRLVRACVAQSAEFAARMVEKYRGEFGGLIAKWLREERNRQPARGDGGRTDIVMDLERLASRGLIERPVRLATPPPPRQSAVLPPPPGARKAAAAAAASRPAAPPAGRDAAPPAGRDAASPPPREPMAARPAPGAPKAAPGQGGPAPRRPPGAEPAARRDFMAERAARNAGAMSSREASRVSRPKDGAADGSAMHRIPPRREPGASPEASGVQRRDGTSAGGRRDPTAPVPRRDASGVEPRSARPGRVDPEGARIGPPPSRLGQGGARPRPPPSAASGAPEAPARARIGPPPSRLGGPRASSAAAGEPMPPGARERSRVAPDADGSRVAPAGDGSRVAPAAGGSRVAPAGDGSRVGPAGGARVAPAGDGSRVGPAGGSRVAPAGDGSRVGPAGGSRVAPAGDGSRVAPAGDGSRVGPAGGSRVAPAGDGSRVAPAAGGSRIQRPPEAGSRVRPRPEAPGAREDSEGSRVFRSRSSVSIAAVRPEPPREGGAERPPRVLAGRAGTAAGPAPAGGQEGTSVQRRPRSPSGTDDSSSSGSGGRGPRGGTR
ncbi:hypothetical protein LXT21_17275 [Myxococcus sp. K38C18041901]|uniref:hypothetical protein n=1 Tax=Myxococcus guangdongensis TaxID=2906760 RepID=UPI0020A6E12C|nr:hypothetical protein [Myxococcus guangdongensis]MCP3060536.1 hypothetical protein [Myxococcus guangdongensis]